MLEVGSLVFGEFYIVVCRVGRGLHQSLGVPKGFSLCAKSTCLLLLFFLQFLWFWKFLFSRGFWDFDLCYKLSLHILFFLLILGFFLRLMHQPRPKRQFIMSSECSCSVWGFVCIHRKSSKYNTMRIPSFLKMVGQPISYICKDVRSGSKTESSKVNRSFHRFHDVLVQQEYESMLATNLSLSCNLSYLDIMTVWSG